MVCSSVCTRRLTAACLILGTVVLAGCGSTKERAPALAIGYAGPATLPLRAEIPLDSRVVATVKHGERLEVVGRRRVFMKVRTPSGIEGWTSERQLLSGEEMEHLAEVSKQSGSLPSQGVATTFDVLNVHSEPSRFSPGFMQIKPGEKVRVLAHRVTPRVNTENRKPLIPPKPKPVKKPKKRETESKGPPVPPPPARLPANWLELSKTPVIPNDEPPPPPPPVPMDDWTMVRNAAGLSGWVLTSRLFMAIPDDVAQYAEGKRITSYFSLGEVRDEDKIKHNWLWTTISQSLQPYDFDSFRVFIWSLRRHRFETAYIERNLKGYYPVLLGQVQLTNSLRGAATTTSYPGFSVCVEKGDGLRYRRSYAFIVNVVRFAGEAPCEAPKAEKPREPAPAPLVSVAQNPKRTLDSLLRGLKARWEALRKRWLGK